MAKLTNIRERVQQPFRDALVRTAGLTTGSVQERNELFQNNNNQKTLGDTNLRTGNVLPSDQSMIILALRCFLGYRQSILRRDADFTWTGDGPEQENGDISVFPNATGEAGSPNSMGDTKDVYRLFWQSQEQLLWSFGAGQKLSIDSMPSIYFPYGGGLVSDLAGSSDLVHLNNGAQTHGSILKLARAILLVPRQNITCVAQIVRLSDGGQAQTFGTTQGSRNMLNLADNLNAIDAIQKVVTFTFDGLLSRDVQLATGPRESGPWCRPDHGSPTRPAPRGAVGLLLFYPSATRECATSGSLPTGEFHMTMGAPSFQQFNELARQLRLTQDAVNQLSQQNGNLNKRVVSAEAAVDVLSRLRASGMGGTDGGGSEKRNGPMCKAWGGQGYVSVDDIPGRVYPFDYQVDIPIASGNVSDAIGNIYISMEGPFVATHRVAIFRSDHTFRAEDEDGNVSAFNGRSNGRFRPVSSNSDIMDAVRAFDQLSQYQPSYLGGVIKSDDSAIYAVGNPVGVNANSGDITNLLPNFPGSGRPIVASPFSMSSFRTMSFDALISVEVAGANFQRQSQRVPSAFWTKNFGEPFPLGALDVFEPGESVTFKVTPTHPNNPAYGNVSSLVHKNASYGLPSATGLTTNDPLPAGPFPFIQGTYDGHEGINDETIDTDTDTTTDRITRSENGILTIGYVGYRIVQPPQMAR
jgi:hypothetical protein